MATIKKAKAVHDLGYTPPGHVAHMNERRKDADPEMKPFVRVSRDINYTGNYDTQWCTRLPLKNWKSRCRKAKQWMKHVWGKLEKNRLDKFVHYWHPLKASSTGKAICGSNKWDGGQCFNRFKKTCPKSRKLMKNFTLTPNDRER